MSRLTCYQVAGFSWRRFEDSEGQKLKTKVMGSEPMESSNKGGKGSSWTMTPVEETKKKEK
jgi:hypothetical protein